MQSFETPQDSDSGRAWFTSEALRDLGVVKFFKYPDFLAHIDPKRQTPARATVLVAAATVFLILFFPLVDLARITSLVTLGVFSLVNISLYVLGRRKEVIAIGHSRWVGLTGALLCIALATWQIANTLT